MEPLAVHQDHGEKEREHWEDEREHKIVLCCCLLDTLLAPGAEPAFSMDAVHSAGRQGEHTRERAKKTIPEIIMDGEVL